MNRRQLIVVTASIFFFFSCSSKLGLISENYGKIEANRDVTASFQNYMIKEDHIYYTSGPDSYPNAMIGIDRRYVLDSRLWKARNLTPQLMKTLVDNMQSKAREYGSLLHGFDILDNKGNDIGDRYSILSLTTTVRMTGTNKIVISTPPIDVYEQPRLKIRRSDERD